MDDYLWSEFQLMPLHERYPPHLTWLLGRSEWLAGASTFTTAGRAGLAAWLNNIRSMHAQRRSAVCPRVFVSHRQIDEKPARRVAWLACQAGFDFWLDVIDLDPQLNPQVVNLEKSLGRPLDAFEKSILTAATIEMALLNCSYVLAVMTGNTIGSQWVPYEYGRVKDAAPLTTEAASWWDPKTVLKKDLPEYLYLGVVLDNEQQIEAWLRSAMAQFPGCSSVNRGRWGDPEPAPLPSV